MLSCSCKNPGTTRTRFSDDSFLPVNSSASKSEVASNIDLLRHILLCLPVKSLLVFKSVSKRWLSNISDPYFVHNHCLRNRLSIPGFFLQLGSFPMNPEFEYISLDGKVTGSLPFKDLNFVNDPVGIKIEQSCNGLLLCSSFRANNNDRTYYIYNLSTKNYTVLPRSRLNRNGFVSLCSVNLASDPTKSNHYEVVCIWADDKYNYQIEIYYSKTAAWRVAGSPFTAHDALFYRSGVFWNGSLHWVSIDESYDWTSLGDSSYYFDMGQELLRKMPLPPIPDEEWVRRKIGYFGECRGHLHLIQIFGPVTTSFDILEMEIDYSRWTVKYRVDLEVLTITYPEMVHEDEDTDDDEAFEDHFEYSVLLVDENEDSSKLVLQIPDKVISYDLKEKDFKKLHDLSSGIQYEWFNASQYIESLACV